MERTRGPFQYGSSIKEFLADANVAEKIAFEDEFATERSSKASWATQVELLKRHLLGLDGHIFFEFKVPRLGLRIDTILIVRNVVFVVEFKIASDFGQAAAINQVWDYALDLRNFHEPSHTATIVPVVAAPIQPRSIQFRSRRLDHLFDPLVVDLSQIRSVIDQAPTGAILVDGLEWAQGRYLPTPTIIEAAKALYKQHDVEDITRSDAAAKNLTLTTTAVDRIIADARTNRHKSICFVTGVPGAGKTLVGLNVATKHNEVRNDKALHATYLSGNGPLVSVLSEALARDRKAKALAAQKRFTLQEARSEVKAFIQIVHHYRDAYVKDKVNPPADHVALFDEAQRAWNLEQTANFMKTKKGELDFSQSEPEFLISCLDRHEDWATIVCLVGGGQEINKGEAGIEEWIRAIQRRFRHWKVFLSDRLLDREHNPRGGLSASLEGLEVYERTDLHLAVSMRSFRSERVSSFVQTLLELEQSMASQTLHQIQPKFPVVLTRSVDEAREWLRQMRRGTERSGLVASSKGERLKAKGIHVKNAINPVHWFLEDESDVRSSCFHEDVATEFDVQGLELDWTGVLWDADFRHNGSSWEHHEFKGSKWQRIHSETRRSYQKNAYRVLLTRARQGMVLVVPEGNPSDKTREPKFYDGTYEYLRGIGIPTL